MGFQAVGQANANRSLHLWFKRCRTVIGELLVDFKCVLCGGVVKKNPTDDCTCDKYEKITEEERGMAPPVLTKRQQE